MRSAARPRCRTNRSTEPMSFGICVLPCLPARSSWWRWRGSMKALVLELVREVEPAPVPGVGVEVHHDLVHARRTRCRACVWICASSRPERIPSAHAANSSSTSSAVPVARVAVGVPEPGEGLVQRVPGRPLAVEVERRRADLSLGQLTEAPAAALQSHQVSVAVGVLHVLQLVHDVVRPLLEALVAPGGVHEAHGRQVMPRDVAGEVAAASVPTAVRLRLRLQPRTFAEVRQHAVGLELEQIFLVELLGVFERPSRLKPDRVERQAPGLKHLVFDRAHPGVLPGILARVLPHFRGLERKAIEQRHRTGPEAELESGASRYDHECLLCGLDLHAMFPGRARSATLPAGRERIPAEGRRGSGSGCSEASENASVCSCGLRTYEYTDSPARGSGSLPSTGVPSTCVACPDSRPFCSRC